MLQDAPIPPQAPRLTPIAGLEGSLGQRVYLTLREAILALALAPGEMLRKPEICAELGVSRSPVSEALLRLQGEGLVDILPQSGSFVAKLSMEAIREGAFLREAIEVAAIARVAESVTDDQIAGLQTNLAAQAARIAGGDIAGFYALDREMHELLLGFTGFRRLAQVSDTAWVHVNRTRRLILPVLGRVEATLQEHRAIVIAVAARDAGAAQTAMQAHLRQLMTYLETLAYDRPELFVP